jgi:peptide/nickel transport system permease protein
MSTQISFDSLRPAVTTKVLSARRNFWRRLGRHRAGRISVIWLGFIGLVAIMSPWIAPRDPYKQNSVAVLSGPTRNNLLGTDELGRDVLSRLITGARVDLGASLAAVFIALILGALTGVIVGLAGKKVDLVIMRSIEGVQAIPGIIVLSVVIAIVGRGVKGSAIALGLAFTIIFVTTTRAAVREVREEAYVASARVMGIGYPKIVLRYIIPNILPTLLAITSTMFGAAFIGLAGLALIGLGPQAPSPSWGAMLQKGSLNIGVQFFAVLPPGIAIASVSLAANTLGEAAREILHPAWRPRRKGASSPGPVSLEAHLPDIAPPLVEAKALTMTKPAASTTATTTADQTGRNTVMKVRDLRVSFTSPDGDERRVVRGVDLDLAAGEILGLVGESGSGKTMTVLSLLGSLPPTAHASASSIWVGGEDLALLDRSALGHTLGTKVGLVFQSAHGGLNPARRVREQVGEVLRVHRRLHRSEVSKRVNALLASVGISDVERVASSFPHELSGGMAQRVMLAGALAADPVLLVADEPTTALDVTVQAQVLDLLREQRADRDMAILFVTHDLAVVADLCDRMAVMYAGEIVEQGLVSDLFRSPQHPYTRSLLDGSASPVRETGGITTGCSYANRCSFRQPVCTNGPIALAQVGETSVRCAVQPFASGAQESSSGTVQPAAQR